VLPFLGCLFLEDNGMYVPEFALILREAAPYINSFSKKTFVIALTGESILAQGFDAIVQDIALLMSLDVHVVLVFDVRAQLQAELALRGQTLHTHQDRAIISAANVPAIKAAVGAALTDLNAYFSRGMPNSGSHKSRVRTAMGNWISARPFGIVDGVDHQFSGRVRQVYVDAMQTRLRAGELLIVPPIAYSLTGEAFLLEMPEVAVALADALAAEKLIFLLDETDLWPPTSSLSLVEAKAWLEKYRSDISPRCLPVFESACAAVALKVGRSHLLKANENGALLTELFTQEGSGTMISKEPLVTIRQASLQDVGDILALIAPLEALGVLVHRSRKKLEMDILDYHLLAHDGHVFGCASLHEYPADEGHELMFEVGCLVITPDKQRLGWADYLLQKMADMATEKGGKALFVLTTQTAHWFLEHDFMAVELEALPLARQATYNHQRASRIFVRRLADAQQKMLTL
jgi:amino-acid N-acetyltransferase